MLSFGTEPKTTVSSEPSTRKERGERGERREEIIDREREERRRDRQTNRLTKSQTPATTTLLTLGSFDTILECVIYRSLVTFYFSANQIQGLPTLVNWRLVVGC